MTHQAHGSQTRQEATHKRQTAQPVRLSHPQWNSIVGILGGFSLLHTGENKEAINKIALHFGVPPQPRGKKK